MVDPDLVGSPLSEVVVNLQPDGLGKDPPDHTAFFQPQAELSFPDADDECAYFVRCVGLFGCVWTDGFMSSCCVRREHSDLPGFLEFLCGDS